MKAASSTSEASARRRAHAPLVLLGPQRVNPSISGALSDLRVKGAVAIVTAGWEEREPDTDELRDHLGRDIVHLELFRRTQEIFAADPDVLEKLRLRQKKLRQLQRLYRMRLGHAMAAARELLQRPEHPEFVAAHLDAAVRALRTLDRGHLEQVSRVQNRFDAALDLASRPVVQRHREEVRGLVQDAGVLAIAGGHVAILLNRLRLYDVIGAAGDMPIVAWSAGAMALGERIVLFHDTPPQGAGNAEVLRHGLGCYGGVIPLPHARRRLILDDPVRVSLFARRFAPDRCVSFDDGARLDQVDGVWRGVSGVSRLTPAGDVDGALKL